MHPASIVAVFTAATLAGLVIIHVMTDPRAIHNIGFIAGYATGMLIPAVPLILAALWVWWRLRK